MILNIVRSFEHWQNNSDLLIENAINFPASVNALLELKSNNHKIVCQHDVISKDQYLALCCQATQITHELVKLSNTVDSLYSPNLVKLSANCIFKLLCQILVFEKVLSALKNEYNISKVRIENLDSFDNRGWIQYGESSEYYHRIAQVWCNQEKIPCENIDIPKHQRLNIALHSGRTSLKVFRTINKGSLKLGNYLYNMLSYISGNRSFVLLFKLEQIGIGKSLPGWVIEIGKAVHYYSRIRMKRLLKNSNKKHPYSSKIQACLIQEMGEMGKIAVERIKSNWQDFYPIALIHYKLAKKLCRFFNKLNIKLKVIIPAVPALYNNKTTTTITNGIYADAFNKNNIGVYSLQHGGNYLLFHRSASGHLFSDFIYGKFLSWGNGRFLDHKECGIDVPLKIRTVGALHMNRNDPERSKDNRLNKYYGKHNKIKVLYAPSGAGDLFFNHSSTPNWHRYIPLVDETLSLLNENQRIETIVTMPVSAKGFFEEIDAETKFSSVNFRYDLKFIDVMHHCDLMIIDTSNSTLFEALTVKKPAIVYGGLENVTMAEPVFAMLKNRFLFAETDKKHLMNIHKFIKNPKEFINYFPADINDVSLLKKYIQPVSYKLFWDRIGKNVLFL